MKKILLTATLALAWLAPISAEPVPPHALPEEAKWFLHVDLQGLRQTKIGAFAVSTLLEQNKKAIEEMKEKMKFDPVVFLGQLNSLTAYGTDYALGQELKGVLLLNAGQEALKIIQGFLAAQALASKDGEVAELQQEPYSIYSVHSQFFVSPVPSGPVVVSKSRRDLEQARERLAQGAPARPAGFTDFPEVPDSFFFLGVAEGFADNHSIPPQARILQMTEGGRVVLGERKERLFLSIDLKSKSQEVTRQIQQVIEGMLALVSLAQSENKELQELASSVKVSSSDRLVTLKADYPVSKVITRFAPARN